MRFIAPVLLLTLCMGCEKEEDTASDTAAEDTAEQLQPLADRSKVCPFFIAVLRDGSLIIEKRRYCYDIQIYDAGTTCPRSS